MSADGKIPGLVRMGRGWMTERTLAVEPSFATLKDGLEAFYNAGIKQFTVPKSVTGAAVRIMNRITRSATTEGGNR